MLEIGNLTGIVPIAVICWLIGLGIKQIPKIDNKVIPVIVGVAGLILGILGHYLRILGLDSMDIYTAAACGILSGGTSTYVNEIIKQFTQKYTEENIDKENN